MAENKNDIKSGRVKRLWEWMKENSLSLIKKVWGIIFELLFGVLLVGLGLLLFWLWDVFDFSSLIEGASDGTGAQPPVTFSNLSEFIRAAFIGVGVIGAGYGLYLAAKRTEKFATQVENSQAQLFNDRLGRGVELLPNDEMIMRSAGIRILENLGENSSPQETALIVDILFNFLNSKGKVKKIIPKQGILNKITKLAPISITETNREERIDIENCLNTILKLAERLGEDSADSELMNLDLRKLKLTSGGMSFFHLNMINCDLTEAQITVKEIEIVRMTACNLSLTDFLCSSLSKIVAIHFCYCYLSGFRGFKFRETFFYLSNLSRAFFTNATLSRVDFIDCNLDGANFTNATFEDVKFESCTFLCTDFSGVDLAGVSGITQEELNKIIYDEKNLPIPFKGLKLPEDRAYHRQTSEALPTFVLSKNEQFSKRLVSDVCDELLEEVDKFDNEINPP